MEEKMKESKDTSSGREFVGNGKIERELAEIRRRYAYWSHNYEGYEEIERDLAKIYSQYDYWSHN